MITDNYKFESDPRIRPYLTEEVRALTRSLTSPYSLSFAEFGAVADMSLTILNQSGIKIRDEKAYLEMHKRRFWEADSVTNSLLAQIHPRLTKRLLDIGFSLNTVILATLFPGVEMYVADLPGRAHQVKAKVGISDAFAIDFTRDVLEDKLFGKEFDIIVFSEVLEHLPASPLRVMRFLIRHLSLDGHLVLTTPNFFARRKLTQISQRINPQVAFPENYRVSNAPGFHIREYCMSELLELIVKAGAVPVVFFFSACWDKEEKESDIFDDTRANIMIVARKRPSAG